MKKFIFLAALGLLISSAIIAQPTITYENAPKIGDVYTYAYFMTPVDPGPGGANQNWDFSNVQADDNEQIEAVNPASTPYENDFPGANIAFYSASEDGEVYTFAAISQTDFQSYGTAVNADTGEIIMFYPDPEKQMEYPFSYQDNFTDSYHSFFNVDFQGMSVTVHRWGDVNVTADAWGSITTPENTFNSVLRIKNESSSVDSIFLQGTFIMAMSSSTTDYTWFNGSDAYPVFSITISNNQQSGDTTGSYTTTAQAIGETSNILNNIRIYPNPAKNLLYVSIPTENESDLRITLIDLTGKEIIRMDRDFSSLNSPVTLDLNNLTPGMYFVRVYDGHNTFTKKVIVE